LDKHTVLRDRPTLLAAARSSAARAKWAGARASEIPGHPCARSSECITPAAARSLYKRFFRS